MKNILVVLVSISILSGCISPKSYVDPSYANATYDDIQSSTKKYNANVSVEFQRAGKPLGGSADKTLQGHVERTLRATGIMVPTSEPSDISIKVIFNNIGESGAAGKGFATGLTFGAIGSLLTDYYEITVIFSESSGEEIKTNYKHALHTTIGNKKAPFEGVEETTISDGFATIVEQVILNFIADMQTKGLLTQTPDINNFRLVTDFIHRIAKS